jgi:CTP-dependent riboflavin kinase
MAQATNSLRQIQVRITTASRILAQLRARQAVKRQLQAKGEKVTHYSAGTLACWQTNISLSIAKS